jgi:arylsulfatase A-like enzyme
VERHTRAAAAIRSATERPKDPQFYSMLGSRSIWHDGWTAVTTHPTISGWSNFGRDTWELYISDVDRSELHELASEEPSASRR